MQGGRDRRVSPVDAVRVQTAVKRVLGNSLSLGLRTPRRQKHVGANGLLHQRVPRELQRGYVTFFAVPHSG